MTYASRQDLIDTFGEDEILQLTDRARSGVPDDLLLDRALARADDEVNGYLAARYTLPFASPPRILRRLASDLARYHLYTTATPEEVRTRYADALRFLRAVADGSVQLGLDAANTPIGSSLGEPEFRAPPRVFTHDTLKDL